MLASQLRRVALLVLLGASCWAPTRAQVSPFPSSDWDSLNDAGERAYERRQYAASENFLNAALQQAQRFGPNDLRVATTLNDLGLLYRAEGKFKEAEPLYRRSLAIREKKLGPTDPAVATSLNNLAGLLAAENRYTEA
jgi:tetratricopeptide (TPR) repeat protein